MAGTFGKWSNVLSALAGFKAANEQASKLALFEEAQFFRTMMLEGLRQQAPGGKNFKPLSEETIAVRKLLGFRGKKVLLKHGDLRNAISVIKDSSGSVFVGVPRAARSKDGHSLIDVAIVHEHGSKPIVVKMTPKMRALLHKAFQAAGINRRDRVRAWRKGAHTSTGIIVVQIPARPFIQPVIDEFGKPADMEKRLAERYAKGMRVINQTWVKLGSA